MPPRISKASPQTLRASRVARNFKVGVRMRSSAAASWLPPSARSSTSAVRKLIDSACSVASMIFISCRRPSGRSMMRLPNTTRLVATVIGAAFLLGHELAALGQPVHVGHSQAVEIFVPQLLAAETRQQFGAAVRDVDRTAEPELGLVEQEGEGVLGRDGIFVGPAQDAL